MILREVSPQWAELQGIGEGQLLTDLNAYFSYTDPAAVHMDNNWTGEVHVLRVKRSSATKILTPSGEIKTVPGEIVGMRVPTGLILPVAKWLRDTVEEMPEILYSRPSLSDVRVDLPGLYGYQRRCAETWLRSGGRGIINIGMGGGKTSYVAPAVFRALLNAGVSETGVFLCERLDVMVQAQQALSNALKAPVGLIGGGEVDIQQVTVATYQSLLSAFGMLGKKDKDTVPEPRRPAVAELVRKTRVWVIDECFPAGTVVGNTPIQHIRVGDVVPSFNESTLMVESRTVTATMKRPYTGHLVSLATRWGKVIATPNHPVFTSVGWLTFEEVMLYVRTGALPSVRVFETGEYPHQREPLRGVSESSQAVGNLCGMPPLQQCVLTDSKPTVRGESGETCLLRESVQGGAYLRCEGCALGPHQSEVREQQDAAEQPNAPGGDTAQSKLLSEEEGSWTLSAGREREAHPSQPSHVTAGIVGERVVPGIGIRAEDQGVTAVVCGEPLSRCVQDRPGSSVVPDCYRGSGAEPLLIACAGGRSEEGTPIEFCRVDSAELLEQGDPGGSWPCGWDGYVYNLEVDGLHTYLVGAWGAVVHNCHNTQSKGYNDLLSEKCAPESWFRMGLSGTPLSSLGMDLKLDALIGPIIEEVPLIELMRHDPRILADATCKVHWLEEQVLPIPKVSAAAMNSYPAYYQGYIVQNDRRNAIISGVCRDTASRGLSIAALIRRIEHGERLEAMTPGSVFVHGGWPMRKRAEVWDALRKKDILIVYSTLIREALDIPSLNESFYACAGDSEIGFPQSMRCLRSDQGRKTECTFHIIMDPMTGGKTWFRDQSRMQLEMVRAREGIKIVHVGRPDREKAKAVGAGSKKVRKRKKLDLDDLLGPQEALGASKGPQTPTDTIESSQARTGHAGGQSEALAPGIRRASPENNSRDTAAEFGLIRSDTF